MANDCWYNMCAVGPKESLERLISIMRYEDPKLFIYRVFSVEMNSDIEPIDDKRCIVYLSGDVAWSMSSWVNDDCCVYGKEKKLYVNLLFLSKLLHIDFEIQAEEPGCAFQQHCAIVDGEVTVAQACDWFDLFYDKTDHPEPKDIIKDLDRIIEEYDGIKELFKKKDIRKKMIDEIFECYNRYDSITIELGGYGRDTVVEDDIIDGNVKEWKTIPYEIIY